MRNLPYLVSKFPVWWLFKAPQKIFKILFQITRLINEKMAFTLNIKLFFTPLYGDYSIIGRFIGMVMRLFMIVAGIFFVGFMVIISILAPLFWFIAPLYILDTYRLIGVLLYFIGTSAYYYLTKKDIPIIKISKNINNYPNSFTPRALSIIYDLKEYTPQKIQKFLSKKQIKELLIRCEMDNDGFLAQLSDTNTANYKRIIDTAFLLAKRHGCEYVHTEHILPAIIHENEKYQKLLATYNTTIEIIEGTVAWITTSKENYRIWNDEYEVPGTSGFGHGLVGRVTPDLDSISTDFTKLAARGTIGKIIGRSKEIENLANSLGGLNQNVLLIGEAGSGKTSIVKGLAQEIVFGTKFKSLINKRLVSLELGGIIDGTTSVGEIAEKINRAMDDARGSGDIILFIDEIHNLASNSIFALLEPHLASSQIQFIGATTTENFRKFIEPNGSFANLFKILEIPEASEEDTKAILLGMLSKYEQKYKIKITYPAIETIIKLSKKLIHERVFPDKAIDILNRTCDKVAQKSKILTTEHVKLQISEFTHIPVESVSEHEAKKLLNLEENMKRSVIGQDNAIRFIAAALKRARVGLRDESKPIASFLFVGTTGVGKTETAKTLAKEYFGDKKAMVRLDMSEYQTPDSINKLIGNSDGSTLGILIEQIRTKPYTVVLLDEIEKAHPQILLTFLQVLDDGLLTQSDGKTIDFTNTIIIATINVGTREIQDKTAANATYEEMREVALKSVREHFAPEFLNRFTAIIVFNPLTEDNIRKITDLMLSKVVTLAANKGIKVDFKPDLIEELIKRGYNREWGARPMARAIEDSIETYIAQKILTEDFKQGDHVTLGMEVFDQV